MATRKKKTETGTWPKVVKGSHLTVTTYENGKTELVWDDAQLLQDVRDAIAMASVAKVAKLVSYDAPKKVKMTVKKTNKKFTYDSND